MKLRENRKQKRNRSEKEEESERRHTQNEKSEVGVRRPIKVAKQTESESEIMETGEERGKEQETNA